MESRKIVAMSVMAAIFYGVIHDQFTIRICPEYFTVFHPHLIDTHSLTVLAAAWGVVATWWVGLPIGILLAAAARIGRNRFTARRLLPFVSGLLLFMACCAVGFGIAGFRHGTVPAYMASHLPSNMQQRFAADWWAHMASYASGIFGGLVTCGLVVARRIASRERSTVTIGS